MGELALGVAWHEHDRHQHREDADGQVDEEDPAPAQRIREVATEDRPERRPGDQADPEERLRRRQILAGKRLE
jgi:hypothetical protein